MYNTVGGYLFVLELLRFALVVVGWFHVADVVVVLFFFVLCKTMVSIDEGFLLCFMCLCLFNDNKDSDLAMVTKVVKLILVMVSTLITIYVTKPTKENHHY